MTPKESIKALFQAIENKDLAAVKEFLPEEGPIAAILNDGSVVEEIDELVEFFEEWFHEDEWTMSHELVFVEESSEMAFGVLDGDYSSQDEDGRAFSVNVFTTCIMRKVDGKWQMVHFQQTEGETDDEE